MFNQLQPLPMDPILGLMAAYQQDPNPNKIDLGVGVYKDENGHTAVLDVVKKAEAFRLETEDSKAYIGMAGNAGFNSHMQTLLLGESAVTDSKRARTIQTPGGTGALRVAAEFLNRCRKNITIWVSAPTWANHMSLFEAAGLTVKEYPYYDYENKDLKFAEMKQCLSNVAEGDVVLFHACCHNPSGMDLNQAQWDEMAQLALERGFTPMVDIAYLGFGSGLEDDAYGVRVMANTVPEVIICSSCSKNFGLYRERIGAVTLVADSAAKADIAQSVVLSVVRSIYSMPPAHGAAIVETILASAELRNAWEMELAVMRDRINGLRRLIHTKLTEKGVVGDFSFIERQHGMFSFLGIDKTAIERLRSEYSIYMVNSSRVNVAGVNHANIDYFAEAVAKVLK